MDAIASTEVLNKLAEDLRFLFDQRQVDTDVQICFADLGLTTTSLFALLGDDVANVRDAPAAPPFNLDPTANGLDLAAMLKRRIAQAKVLDAWQAAKCRADEKNKAEAKQRTSGMPISLTQGEHVSLRQSFEKDSAGWRMKGSPRLGWSSVGCRRWSRGIPRLSLCQALLLPPRFRPTRGT